jgi:hypothetical protein
MGSVIGGLRGDLAQAGLECLEPDLIILDEFQRFRDLLYKPADGEEDAAAELARQFLNYDGAKLLLLSATPYKAHTSANEVEGDDHAADFRQLLKFLSREKPGYIEALALDLDERRRQLMGHIEDDNLTGWIEDSLKQFMCRTERPQLGEDDMLTVIPMAPVDVRSKDLASFRSMSAVFRAGKAGSPMEYWKSVPMFAHFLTDYKIGRVIDGRIHGDHQAVTSLLPDLCTIDAEAYRRYGAVETDNAKFRAVRDHTTGRGWWQLLWMPPSFPYLKPGGPFASVGSDVTKQLVFSAWNATPTALTTMLSYEAERHMMSGSELNGENTAEARKRFRGRLRYRVSEGAPRAMSALALFIPHAEVAMAADPFAVASSRGSAVAGSEARATAAAAGRVLTGGKMADESRRLGSWATYFSIPGALPPQWNGEAKLIRQEIKGVADYLKWLGHSDAPDAETDSGEERRSGSDGEADLYMVLLTDSWRLSRAPFQAGSQVWNSWR